MPYQPETTIDQNDLEERADWQRRESRRHGNRRFPCPTCRRESALSASQNTAGYQCDRCADIEEGAF